MRIVVKGPVWNFVQHLLEMTIAMFAGMVVLGMTADMLFESLGWTVLTDEMVPSTLLMAAYMTIGMALWMRVRGCRWRLIAEMSLAMFVPFLVMYPPYFAGMASADAVMTVGHVLMIPAMAVAMLFRRDEYTGSHGMRKREEEPRELVSQQEG